MTDTELNNYLHSIDSADQDRASASEIWQDIFEINLAQGYSYNVSELESLIKKDLLLTDPKIRISIENDKIFIQIDGIIHYSWLINEDNPYDVWNILSSKQYEKINNAIIEFEDQIEEL